MQTIMVAPLLAGVATMGVFLYSLSVLPIWRYGSALRRVFRNRFWRLPYCITEHFTVHWMIVLRCRSVADAKQHHNNLTKAPKFKKKNMQGQFPLVAYITADNVLETSDSSSDDELEILLTERARQQRILRPRIENYMQTIRLYSDLEFKSHFRMRRDTFNFLLELIESKLTRQCRRYGRYPIPPRMQLLIAVWTMATPDSYRSICDRFNVGKATAWRAVRRVSNAIYALAPRFITWPTRDEAIRMMNTNVFPKVIGAIDGTHIQIAAPHDHPAAYINRKGYHSIQLQVVCDANLKLIHCYAGQVGSIHDMRVFRLSNFEKKLTDEYFPDDSHILADAAYTIHKHAMVPYRDNGHLSDAENNYNTCHSSTRMMVERSIALLKGRFRSLLDNLPMQRTDLIPRYIIACCVMHNVCILRGDLIDIPIIVQDRNIQDADNAQNIGNQARTRQEGIEKRNAITYALRHLMN